MAHRILAGALAACLLVGGPALAKDYGKDTLLGTWSFDVLQMMKDQFQGAGAELPPGMSMETLEAMLKDTTMHITFAKDGTWTLNHSTPMGRETESGSWEVVQAKDNAITLKITSADEGEEMRVLTFQDQDNFSSEMGDGEMKGQMHARRLTDEEVKALHTKLQSEQ